MCERVPSRNVIPQWSFAALEAGAYHVRQDLVERTHPVGPFGMAGTSLVFEKTGM
jgi:hypothetical protein